MSERPEAVLTVLCLCVIAWAFGDFILRRGLKLSLTPAVSSLSAFYLGVGLIGTGTAVCGALLGFSPRIIRVVSLGLCPLALAWLVARLRHGRLPARPRAPFGVQVFCILTFALVAYHAIFFLLSGLSYPVGSDSFQYVQIPQEFLRQQRFALPVVEPLQNEVTPFFNIPCLIEMIYLLGMANSNLIAASLFAHLMIPLGLIVIFVVALRISNVWAALFALSVLLLQPILLYFFRESLDNYWITLSFEMLAFYFTWLFAESRDTRHSALAGVFLGLMFSAKATTVFYFIAILLFVPFLVLSMLRGQQRGDGQLTAATLGTATRWVLTFWLPAGAVASVFPLIVLVKSGAFPYGLEFLQPLFGLSAYRGWYQHFFSIFDGSPFLHYPDEFAKRPDMPAWLAPVVHLLRRYTNNNPLQLALSGTLTNVVWSPVTLAVYAGSLASAYYGWCRRQYFYFWIAGAIWSAYLVKLFLRTQLDPPKSEIFVLVPALLLVAGAFSERFARRGAVALVGVCVLLGAINAVRLNDEYVPGVKRFAFASFDEVALVHRQSWYNEVLNDEDVILGRNQASCAYVRHATCPSFYWVSMFYVDWEVIEQRIRELGVTVIYDDAPRPESYFSVDGLKIVKRRDPLLYLELKEMEARYRRNLVKKQAYLDRAFSESGGDGIGKFYYHKR